MNMDQVLVLTYTDRNHKTRVLSEEEFYEMFVCENDRGRCLNSEDDWLEIFNGEFGYIKFYQAVIDGNIHDFQKISEQLNSHWSSRHEVGVNGVYGFVNAGSLDRSLFNEHTFDTQEPSDYQMWKKVREYNYTPGSTLDDTLAKTLAKMKAKQLARGHTVSVNPQTGEATVEKSPRKPWLL